MFEGVLLDVVDGRYRLETVIGEGAAGTVWLARDERREIHVALKVLRPHLAATTDLLERFVREADLAERMLSPHIVRVLARGTTSEGAPYIAYERLEGEDLGARLGRGGRLSIEESRAVIVHTCRALARAHAIGVLHRDIKPDNLFVTKADGRPLVKVLDFGVAELVRSAERDGPLVGTLEYLAPEVVLGERAPSARSDLFSLGIVAYRCLAGVVPFRADNMGQLVLAHARSTPRPLREIDTRIPPDLERWMDRAIALDPDARWGSAREMAEALDRAVVKLDIKATATLPRLDSRMMKRRESSRYAVVTARDDADEREKKEEAPAAPRKDPRREP